MAEHQITIAPDGTVQFIYSDELVSLLDEGRATVQRASQVEPGPDGWKADLALSSGPVLGGFRLHSEAIAAEVEWLRENVL